MSVTLSWLSAGRGKQPEVRWSFETEGKLKTLCLAGETGEVMAADDEGRLYLLSRSGELISSIGGFSSLNQLAFSQNGQAAVAVLGDSKLVWLNREGGIVGTKEFSSDILSVAIDPYGNVIAVTLDNGSTSIYKGKRDRLASFTTDRPLTFMQFLTTEPMLLGASEYGLLGLYDLQGDEIWKQNSTTNVGDMTASGDGDRIYLAGFTLGIQKYDSYGNRAGAIQVEGTPRHLSTSDDAKQLAVSTLENHLHWVDHQGRVIWETTPPADVVNLCCDPLGDWLICGLANGKIFRLDWRKRKGGNAKRKTRRSE